MNPKDFTHEVFEVRDKKGRLYLLKCLISDGDFPKDFLLRGVRVLTKDGDMCIPNLHAVEFQTRKKVDDMSGLGAW